MKERLLTFTLAVGALLLFYALIFPKPTAVSQRPSQPLSTDGGPDGQLAVWRWLQAQSVPVSSLRYRYDRLGTPDPSPIGNLLITVMPHQLPIRSDEWSPIERWVESGNTLLVMAALDDTPRWALFANESFVPELRQLTQLSFRAEPQPKKASADTQSLGNDLKSLLGNTSIEAEPRAEHPLLSGVHRLDGASAFPASHWQVETLKPTLSLSLLQRTDSGAAVLWLLQRGRGQIIVCSLASPFSNSQIDRDDNAQLLSNIIAWSRAANGRVIFDDAHQGLTAFYDAHAFFADPRLHRTLWWLLLLWLAFVLGPLPLRSAFSPWKPTDETALIVASGRFYHATVVPVDAAQRLFENFFNRLRRGLNLPESGEPLWEWLANQSRVSRDERSLLQTLYANVRAGERVKLPTLHNLLTDLQGRLT